MADRPLRHESIVDLQIRLAQERGEFDDLPGTGKPVPGKGQPHDEMWWLKAYIQREGLPAQGVLPTGLQLAREVERLPERVVRLPSEQAVRQLVEDLNVRITNYLRLPSGPYVPLAPVPPDAMVQRWRDALAERSRPEPPEVPAAPRRAPWWRRILPASQRPS